MIARLSTIFSQCLLKQVERLQRRFYIYLAIGLTLCVALDASVFHLGENLRQKAFDLVLRSRITVPKPDPDIVIIDINEKSLAALAGDYGRWPWPREVFAEFVEAVEKQHPKAVVFDILFSDADLYNPDSDAYFNETIAATNNTFFPMLRLDAKQDNLSQIKPSMIPGISALADAKPDATIAVVLPHFDAALKAGRLGTHNIYPDPDGISREYRLYHDEYGWQLPSLPLAVARTLGYTTAQDKNMLLNWRGKPFTYQNLSFSEIFRDITAKSGKYPPDAFKDKIIIIGSTASSLADLSATPMDNVYPGVEIVATAIDNLKHQDYLKVWRGPFPYSVLSLLLIWLTASGFYRNVPREKLAMLFGFSQIGLLGISYIGLNLSNFYLDLTAPVTWAIAYFSLAKGYALLVDQLMQRNLANSNPQTPIQIVSLMPIILETPYPLSDAALTRIQKKLDAMPGKSWNINIIKGAQSGVWGLFSEMIVVSWVTAEPIDTEVAALLAALGDILQKLNFRTTTIRHALHQCEFDATRPPAQQWRVSFAEAVLKLESSQY